MRIAIATVHAPFIEGGAEAHAQGLLRACRAAGHEADIVAMPFRFFPPKAEMRSMEQWETEDFECMSGYVPDRVICLKFPSYYLRHPEKAVWLLHQHRAAYELWKDSGAEARELRERIVEKDNRYLREARVLFANSENVARRLKESNGIEARALYHPPPLDGALYTMEAEPFVFMPSRLEELKRQSLLIEAMRYVTGPVFALISGAGGQRDNYRRQIEQLGLGERVRLLGPVSREELLAYYAHCLGVFFGPRDEDYGYVTLESMLARKPVITCVDSGGPLEFVRDGETGFVVEPEARAVAAAIDRLNADRAKAAEMGMNGYLRYRAMDISWENVVALLTQ